jgi:hypothetical protein
MGSPVGFSMTFLGLISHFRNNGERKNPPKLEPFSSGLEPAAALNRFNKWAEIAVARKQHDLIDFFGKLHRIDCDFDVHVAFESAPPLHRRQILCRVS